MDLIERGWDGVDCTSLAEVRDKVESSWEIGNEPFGFHKMLVNYRIATQLVASRLAFSSTQLVS
jgi:hypothetical protein